jgi:adenylate cyclase
LWSLPTKDDAVIDATAILAARILVVDDDADAAATLVQLLAGHGYQNVTKTRRPQDVSELHRTRDFDLILLDVEMPGMDGFEVMEALKVHERDSYLPVLAITGSPGHRVEALKRGARDFVRKPFDADELLLRVRNMIEVRLLYKERALEAVRS